MAQCHGPQCDPRSSMAFTNAYPRWRERAITSLSIISSRKKVWINDLVKLLSPYDVYFVGLHCSLPELERREIQRGNRRTGEARTDLETVHSFAPYDLELDSEDSLEGNVATLIEAWHHRRKPSVFDNIMANWQR